MRSCGCAHSFGMVGLNASKERLAFAPGFVNTSVSRERYSLWEMAAAFSADDTSVGMTSENSPSFFKSDAAHCISLSKLRLSVCLAVVRCLSGHFNAFEKYGGLENIASNFSSD